MSIKIKSQILAIIVVGIFAAGIVITMIFNLWETESSKEPAKYKSGEFAGEYNPADIRGSYSFSDIEAAFDVPAEVLARAFGFGDAEDPGSIKAKDLEEAYGRTADGREIGTDSLRLFVSLWSGLPYKAEAESALPNQSLSILKEAGRISVEKFDSLKEIAAKVSPAFDTTTDTNGENDAAAANEEEHSENEDAAVKGKTTFADLLNWGLSAEEIEEVLGMKMGGRAVTVRDYLVENGLEFSEYKIKLQALVDAKTEE